MITFQFQALLISNNSGPRVTLDLAMHWLMAMLWGVARQKVSSESGNQ